MKNLKTHLTVFSILIILITICSCSKLKKFKNPRNLGKHAIEILQSLSLDTENTLNSILTYENLLILFPKRYYAYKHIYDDINQYEYNNIIESKLSEIVKNGTNYNISWDQIRLSSFIRDDNFSFKDFTTLKGKLFFTVNSKTYKITVIYTIKNNKFYIKYFEELEDEENLPITKKKISNLSKALENYKQGEPNIIIDSIDNLDPEFSKSELEYLYSYDSSTLISLLNSMKEISKATELKLIDKEEEIENRQKELSTIENQFSKYSLERFKQKKIALKRRFSTDWSTSMGIYEAVNFDDWEEIVVLAKPEDVKCPSNDILTYTVLEKGTYEAIVTHSNAYRSWESKEFYPYYQILSKNEDPFVIKKLIDETQETIISEKQDFKTFKDNEIQSMEAKIIKTSKEIVSILRKNV